MASEKKQNIWIQLADVKPIALSVAASDEPTYREAEKLVNTLWDKWMKRFNDNTSSHEVLARVAFQFARLYMETFQENKNVNDFLTDFEQKLDKLVVKI